MGWLSSNRKTCAMQLDGGLLEHKKLKCGCRFRIICCLALPCDSTAGGISSGTVHESGEAPQLNISSGRGY